MVNNLISVAIEIQNEKHLKKINIELNYCDLIDQLVKEFQLTKSCNEYALQLGYINKQSDTLLYKYLDERNLHEIHDGCELKLCKSPKLVLNNIFQRINRKDDRELALNQLKTKLHDKIIIELIYKYGWYIDIFSILRYDQVSVNELAICYEIVFKLIKFKHLSYIDNDIVKIMLKYILIVGSGSNELLEIILLLLKYILLMDQNVNIETILKSISIYHHLLPLISNVEYPQLQCHIISLINTFVKVQSKEADRLITLKQMESPKLRNLIYDCIINKHHNKLFSDVEKELAIYQINILNLQAYKLQIWIEIDEENVIIKDLRDCSNKTNVSNVPENLSSQNLPQTQNNRDSKNSSKFYIGQDFPESPAWLSEEPSFFFSLNPNSKEVELDEATDGVFYTDQDQIEVKNDNLDKKIQLLHKKIKSAKNFDGFHRTKSLTFKAIKKLKRNNSLNTNSSHINQLTLECLTYFKKKFPQSYFISIQDAETHRPGYFEVCESICLIMCSQLQIGIDKKFKSKKLYCPLIFSATNDEPFIPEFFCRIVWLYVRTRTEMHAKSFEDHEKVLDVLSKQIEVVLKMKPLTYQSLMSGMKSMPYSKIHLIWQRERDLKWNSILYNAPCVKELSHIIEPEIIDLIKKNRIYCLKAGEYFLKYFFEKKWKCQEVFLKVSSNGKILMIYDTLSMNDKMSCPTMQINFEEIKNLITKNACPHVKERKVKNPETAFSLLLESNIFLNFESKDKNTFCNWIDGIDCILGKKMKSSKYEHEILQLKEMELTIRLLDVENMMTFSETSPELPPPPENYDFNFN